MNNYEWILFDADETLFHFDAYSGLQLMFSQFGMQFTQTDYEIYESINQPLWVDYQNGTISAKQLQHLRFQSWANKLNLPTENLSRAFLIAMAEVCKPLEGALNLLTALKGKVKLGLITNGFTEMQTIRLEKNGLKDHFDLLVISEEVGFAKPHPQIFQYALSKMGNVTPTKVLIVGDNPDSDIIGGINAGLHTCWFNRNKKSIPPGINPHYQVASHVELEKMLFDNFIKN